MILRPTEFTVRSKVKGGWIGGQANSEHEKKYCSIVHGALVSCLHVLSDFPLQSSTVSQACQLPQISTTPPQGNPTVVTSTEPHTYVMHTLPPLMHGIIYPHTVLPW